MIIALDHPCETVAVAGQRRPRRRVSNQVQTAAAGSLHGLLRDLVDPDAADAVAKSQLNGGAGQKSRIPLRLDRPPSHSQLFFLARALLRPVCLNCGISAVPCVVNQLKKLAFFNWRNSPVGIYDHFSRLIFIGAMR